MYKNINCTENDYEEKILGFYNKFYKKKKKTWTRAKSQHGPSASDICCIVQHAYSQSCQVSMPDRLGISILAHLKRVKAEVIAKWAIFVSAHV